MDRVHFALCVPAQTVRQRVGLRHWSLPGTWASIDGSKVASWIRRLAPRPASRRRAQGRVSPDTTSFQPVAAVRTRPHASWQCSTRTGCTRVKPAAPVIHIKTWIQGSTPGLLTGMYTVSGFGAHPATRAASRAADNSLPGLRSARRYIAAAGQAPAPQARRVPPLALHTRARSRGIATVQDLRQLAVQGQ